MTLNLSPEAMKAWSQNLGHADVITTFTSYGAIPTHQQGKLFRAGAQKCKTDGDSDPIAELEAVLARMKAQATGPLAFGSAN